MSMIGGGLKPNGYRPLAGVYGCRALQHARATLQKAKSMRPSNANITGSKSTPAVRQGTRSDSIGWATSRNLRWRWISRVAFHDDLMRLRTSIGPANLTVVKQFILKLIHELSDKPSQKTRYKALGRDDRYLRNALV